MLSRSERQWQILVSEYKACRKKLQSKREAHQIMLKMLSDHDKEKEQLENKLKSLENAAEELISGHDLAPNLVKFVGLKATSEKGKSVIQGLILHISKMQSDLDKNNQLLADFSAENSDLKKDLKAVRADKTGFNRVMSPVLDNCDRDREDFLAMIQSLKQEVEVCNTRIKTQNDEATDFRIEREFYKQKVKTLTEQLLEKNECQPIAQVEELLVDNRELRDKVDRLQHINAALVSHNSLPTGLSSRPSVHTRGYHSNSYPSSIKKRSRGNKWNKHVTFGEEEEEDEGIGFIRSVKEKVRVETELQHLQTLIQDMQKVSNGLAETVLDKSTALKHQRSSNRLLGERVTELEAKLRALEMSGFWSVPEGCGGSGDENKRDQLRRLTLTSGVSPEPEESGDLLLDPFLDTEGQDVVVTPSPQPTLLICGEDLTSEYTQLLSESPQHDTSNDHPSKPIEHFSMDNISDHLITPSDPLLPRGDHLLPHDEPLFPRDENLLPGSEPLLAARSEKLFSYDDYAGDSLSRNDSIGSDDLVDLLPVKE